MGDEKPEAHHEAISQPSSGHPSAASSLSRRLFLVRVSEFAAAIVTVLLGIPFVRFVMYPLLAKGSQAGWFDLGSAEGFSALTTPSLQIACVTTRDGWLESVSSKAVYVTKDNEGRTKVLSAVCPHLGCTVQWNAEKTRFDCPCHGSEFSPDGAHLAGPAARGMDSLPISIENGNLKVHYEEYRQLLARKEIDT